jgi:hypothetical protein
MLEIFALPYFAISAVIGWVIFQPFFRTEESESLSLTSITISDLLALSLPVGILFLSARWVMPDSILSLSVQAIVVAIALLFGAVALTVGLFLVPKKFQVTFLKRMAVVGIIAPFGILLTVGWIGLLIWAGTYSILYLVPSSIAIAAATSGLRMLGSWVCRAESQVVEKVASPPV